jgi:hypothetical protein
MTGPSERVSAIPIGPSPRRERDPRLDFFRGVGMLIILVAHIPNDMWALWIPARFGFSDATEMFVFLSGMASAMAFGTTFDRAGPIALIARVAQRIWQINWAHICVFVAIVAFMTIAGMRPDGVSYLDSLNLLPFIRDPGSLLVALLTLRYVPNYFDILPMYMIVLALLPIMLIAERAGRALPFALMTALWMAAQFGLVHFSAEPWSERPWFFDPFGWQLVFFTGFFLMRGTVSAPAYDGRVMAVAVAVVVMTVPFAWVRFGEMHPFFADAAKLIVPLTDKSNFGILRFIHFLSLSYIAVHVVGHRGSRLKGPVVRVLIVVGQQSLAVFVTGMVLAQIIGVVLDQAGRTILHDAAANLCGFGTLIATAYLVRWFKQAPWKKRRDP